MNSNSTYIKNLEERVKKTSNWDKKLNNKRYFSFTFKKGYIIHGKTLKEQLIEYYKQFKDIKPSINDFFRGDDCGVEIFLNEKEYQIYKKIIDNKKK